MDVSNLTIAVALGAGLLSFLSPCVLPLVPAYLGQLAAVAVVGRAEGVPSRWLAVLRGVVPTRPEAAALPAAAQEPLHLAGVPHPRACAAVPAGRPSRRPSLRERTRPRPPRGQPHPA